METTYNRANNAKSIAPANRGTPPKSAGSPFADLAQAALIPTGASPSENVSGTNRFSPAAVNQAPSAALAAPTAGSTDSVDLGTEEWEQFELAKAIKSLEEQYQRMATSAGGSITDPYWQDQLDQAVDEAYEGIRSQSANDRQVREENQKNRDLQSSEGALDRAAQLKAADDERKAAESGALWGGLGQMGMGYLTTPQGGIESKLKMVYKPVMDATGAPVIGADGKPMSALQPEEIGGKAAVSPIEKLGKGTWNALTSGFREDASPTAKYLAPTAAGTAIGMALPNSKRGNALSQAAGGFVGSGVGNAVNKFTGGKNSAWGNLVSSAGMAWADPFNKKSWGKRTGDTLLKIGGSQLLSRLLGI